MDDNRLAEIRERAERATPGPWETARKSVRVQGTQQLYPWGHEAPNGYEGGICNCLGGGGLAKHKSDPCNIQATKNADFIAHAREDVPALIAEVERLRVAAENNQTCYVSEMAAHSRTMIELEAATKQIKSARPCKMCIHRNCGHLVEPCITCNMIIKQHFEWARPCHTNAPSLGEGERGGWEG